MRRSAPEFADFAVATLVKLAKRPEIGYDMGVRVRTGGSLMSLGRECALGVVAV
jgi:hypothetical protein